MLINLALSGGGVRGVAHLGVIKAALECGLQINAISGASSGAICGAFFAKGFPPEEVLQICIENAAFNPRRLNLGFYSKKNMERILAKYLGKETFESLKIRLFACVTNINGGRSEYICTGELVPALVASSALPILFPPIQLNGSQYLDGGLLNNLPVEPFIHYKHPIVGVHVNPLSPYPHFTSTLRIVERSIELSVYKNIKPRVRHCDLFIEPRELRRFTIFDFARAREMYDVGYQYGKKKFEGFLKKV